MDDVKVAQEAALANVMNAVESALASAPGKRKPDTVLAPAKRQKAPRHMTDLDGDISSDSDEELHQEADARAAGAELSVAQQKGPGSVNKQDLAAKAGHPSGSGSSGSEQEALGSSLHATAQVSHPDGAHS